MDPGQTKEIEIAYTSQGMDEWIYDFGGGVKQVRNFVFVMTTDFDRIDFPQRSVSPTVKAKTAKGWKLVWAYNNMLTGACIGMTMPKKLNPGPWVSRLTAAAPVSLFLFFFLLFICTTLREIKIHPMNYFFLGAAFFSFHLLLAYLVDFISIHIAFWICSAVSIVLVVSYMRLVAGPRFAFLEVALFQLVYLVVFSYTFFFEGYTGLAITVLCICTLFAVMQMTGRLDWEKVFANGLPKPAKSRKPQDGGQNRPNVPD
ncbi:MAG TPA: inner membrane CreD family protein [Anaerohalosphaeraceae bacterium]|nr:inner membrane CreD family protein [Anaerohalosphaeraceae bacterium]HOL30957.1 inner membrane CreD family protein [Anaerohalosphaeraceae bacterium]HOM75335.1 inner membrane CreD family protein [Anaerohalosphaeraceae bacterium]HPC63323.1 inner membrane CreD family protein [Anaerohalosphaeraceae bacterium]HPO68971.1 inner membrane CreD family protein [Anaerohalosphaeraceae bacterium]